MGIGLTSGQHLLGCSEAVVESVAVTMLVKGMVTFYSRRFFVSLYFRFERQKRPDFGSW